MQQTQIAVQPRKRNLQDTLLSKLDGRHRLFSQRLPDPGRDPWL